MMNQLMKDYGLLMKLQENMVCFQITPYNKTEGQIYCTNGNGTFTLQFSEGTLKGEFYLE